MTAIRIPASDGPRSAVARCVPSTIAFAWATVDSSSPTSSGRISRCAEKYGARKQPIAKTHASSTGKLSHPAW